MSHLQLKKKWQKREEMQKNSDPSKIISEKPSLKRKIKHAWQPTEESGKHKRWLKPILSRFARDKMQETKAT